MVAHRSSSSLLEVVSAMLEVVTALAEAKAALGEVKVALVVFISSSNAAVLALFADR
jgi:hypothetical protein